MPTKGISTFTKKFYASTLASTTDWKISFCLSTLRFNSTINTLIFQTVFHFFQFNLTKDFLRFLIRHPSVFDRQKNPNRTPQKQQRHKKERKKESCETLSITIFYCVNISFSSFEFSLESSRAIATKWRGNGHHK